MKNWGSRAFGQQGTWAAGHLGSGALGQQGTWAAGHLGSGGHLGSRALVSEGRGKVVSEGRG